MSFRGFLADLQNDGLLKEVDDPIPPMLEVTDRARGKGPILFDNAAALRGAPESWCAWKMAFSRLTRMMTREDPIFHGLLQAGSEHKRFLQQVA